MIDRSTKPSIPDTLCRLDIEPGRGRRARCPVHRGDNPSALSWTDEGQWYCHRCGIGGDVITLVQRSLDLDCAGAMRWLGIIPGKPPAPDPAIVRRQRMREGLRRWADSRGRELRDQFYDRIRIEAYALERLNRDHEDALGWELLHLAYSGIPLDELGDLVDRIDLGNDEDRLAAYREWRTAA